MKRNDIELKDTWNLELLYKNQEAFDQDMKEAKETLEKLISLKGKLLESLSTFKSYLELDTLLDRAISRLYTYSHLACDVEPDVALNQTRLASTMSLYQDVVEKLSFVSLELLEKKEVLLTYLEDESLKSYRYKMSELIRQQDHLLSKEMEELLAKVDSISNTGEEVFDALRLEFEPVDVDGKKEFLNQATLNKFLKHENPEVRKQAYTNFFKEYKRYENVFASTLSSTMKKDAFYADIRHFDHSLQASLFNDQVEEALFHKILRMANVKYRPLFHRYNALKKKLLKLETMYNYDLSVPLVKEVDLKFTVEESFDIILDTLKVFGEEYTSILKKAREERWIDYYPCVGKRDGAYSSGCYDSVPYILMNFIGDYNSLSTLIHELGHSCHTYLSNKYQEPHNASYRIFVAEVASTVNETLLINHMLQHASNNQEKAYLLYTLLEESVGLIFRQPMFADFEHQLHLKAERKEPLSSEQMTSLYHQMNQDYFGKDVEMSDLVGVSCYYVPHFYYNYYVYKYTLGMTVALAITSRILENDQEQIQHYLDFLKSGGSMSPVDLLKKAGVDPLDDRLYDDAYHYFERILKQFEDIMIETC